MKIFPSFIQQNKTDCGPACLKIIAEYYGFVTDHTQLRTLCKTNAKGSTLLALSKAAQKIGFDTFAVRTNYIKLLAENPFPCIALMNRRHFVVLYRIDENIIYASDPAFGLVTMGKDNFLISWINKKNEKIKAGVLLLLQPKTSLSRNIVH